MSIAPTLPEARPMRDAITAPDDLRPSTCLRIGLTLDEALAPPVLPIGRTSLFKE